MSRHSPDQPAREEKPRPTPRQRVDRVPSAAAGALLVGVLLLGAGGAAWQHLHPGRPTAPLPAPAAASAVNEVPATRRGNDTDGDGGAASRLPTAARDAAARFTVAYGSRRWDSPPEAWLAELAPTTTARLLNQLHSGSSGAATTTAMAAAHQVDTVSVDAVTPAAASGSDETVAAASGSDETVAAVTYTVSATPQTAATATAGRFTLTVTLVDQNGSWRADAVSV